MALAGAWMWVRWWGARKEDESHPPSPHLCSTYKNTPFLGRMGVKNEVKNAKHHRGLVGASFLS